MWLFDRFHLHCKRIYLALSYDSDHLSTSHTSDDDFSSSSLPNPKCKRSHSSSHPLTPVVLVKTNSFREVKTPTRHVNHVMFSFQNHNMNENAVAMTTNSSCASMSSGVTRTTPQSSGEWHDHIGEESTTIATTEAPQTTN